MCIFNPPPSSHEQLGDEPFRCAFTFGRSEIEIGLLRRAMDSAVLQSPPYFEKPLQGLRRDSLAYLVFWHASSLAFEIQRSVFPIHIAQAPRRLRLFISCTSDDALPRRLLRDKFFDGSTASRYSIIL